MRPDTSRREKAKSLLSDNGYRHDGLATGGRWIASAVNPKHEGAETSAAEKAGMSTHAFMEKHKHDVGVSGRRARLGLTLSNLSKRR